MTSITWQHTTTRLAQFMALTKPRVVSLIVFCAIIGMFLAVPPGVIDARFAWRVIAATLGIALVAGAAAAFNCIVEQKIDAVMARTRGRPLPRGELTTAQTFVFASVVGGLGLAVLYLEVNALTMWLTLATFVGYAIIYTVVLKPMTPQNIVIGGASGAMPPVLGWAAATGDVSFQALLLFLIIFAWTPPHFWALALLKQVDYGRAKVPMAPLVWGERETMYQMVWYTVILIVLTLLPVLYGAFGTLYLLSAIVLNALLMGGVLKVLFAARASKPWTGPAWWVYKYSLLYLALLFLAMAVDRAIRR